MKKNLIELEKKCQKLIKQANSSYDLEKIRIKLLGRKGLANQLFADLAKTPLKKRKRLGRKINLLKNNWQELIESQEKIIKPQKIKKEKEELKQITLVKYGHLHPITVTIREINQLFKKIGFSVYDGPEIETDEYCFLRLNVPQNHPARDLQDTIYIQKPEILLRTQTSSVEAHLLENEKPPFRAVIPGRVYRFEKVTKSNHFIFHHYQGVAVDKNLNLKDLVGLFQLLFEHIYGPKVAVRYRCKYYPEVEPGLGLDIRCFSCQGKGCPLCKNVGWIEMGGSGIIHPKVMEKAGLNPKKWRGLAFGLGLDRWAMAKYNIKDIRTLTGGNLTYLPYQP
ncbi:MAG: phenylalanine--tRNA ligase subunit alpha [Candidatus Shapirobacteria bacterium]